MRVWLQNPDLIGVGGEVAGLGLVLHAVFARGGDCPDEVGVGFLRIELEVELREIGG